MKGMFMQLKVLAIEMVLWAELEFKDKTGAERRAAVIEKLTKFFASKVNLPWYANWAKGAAVSKAVRHVVDLVCEKFNFLTDWSFGGVKINEVQKAELACVLDAPASVLAAVEGKDFNERLDDLYAKYGIAPEVDADLVKSECVKKTVIEAIEALPATANNDNQLSKNLTRKEITCKCGCGFDLIDPKVVELFQAIRDYIGRPVNITSGCRCPDHNRNVGGVTESAHIYGQALDMSVSGLTDRQFGEMIKKAHREGKLDNLRYCYLIGGKTKTAVHIGVDEKTRRGLWGW